MRTKKYQFFHEFLVLLLILPDKFLIKEAEKLLTWCDISDYFSNSRKLKVRNSEFFLYTYKEKKNNGLKFLHWLKLTAVFDALMLNDCKI